MVTPREEKASWTSTHPPGRTCAAQRGRPAGSSRRASRRRRPRRPDRPTPARTPRLVATRRSTRPAAPARVDVRAELPPRCPRRRSASPRGTGRPPPGGRRAERRRAPRPERPRWLPISTMVPTGGTACARPVSTAAWSRVSHPGMLSAIANDASKPPSRAGLVTGGFGTVSHGDEDRRSTLLAVRFGFDGGTTTRRGRAGRRAWPRTAPRRVAAGPGGRPVVPVAHPLRAPARQATSSSSPPALHAASLGLGGGHPGRCRWTRWSRC